jgi:GNAT superfamily N-acetyltransferase
MDSAALSLVTVADRPALARDIGALIERAWPTYIVRAPTAPWAGPVDWVGLFTRWPGLQFGLFDGDQLLASGDCLPLAWDGDPEDLPDEGWDWAMRQGVRDLDAGRAPRTLCALSITIDPAHQGRGLSREMIRRMRGLGRARGLERLIAPVRPSWKSRYPLALMERYTRWTDDRDLPFDPWLRAHVREGGRIVRACPRSMSLVGSVADWESWLGMRLPESGAYTAPGLLNPLTVDRDRDQCVYIEPNVWVAHGG